MSLPNILRTVGVASAPAGNDSDDVRRGLV